MSSRARPVFACVALAACTPGVGARELAAPPALDSYGRAADPAAQLLDVPAGTYLLGDPRGTPDEQPREVTVAAFRLMRTEVTVAQFAAFVAATHHVTDPEREGHGHVWRRHDGRRWAWRIVDGVTWRAPARDRDHAVSMVSQRDAIAFCAHHGLRLPTEEEWEWAARGPDGRRYAWGDAPPESRPPAARGNVGTLRCCAASDADGFDRIAPVGRFPGAAGPFGHLDLVGNVWEWTTSRDERAPGKLVIRGAGWGNSSWCLRAAYRHSNPPARGLDMVGFRCASDV
ncbi:MAG TPA: SUMF1/EgtB/PvdO family nonheme iron enzyme [Kofleriaceae bacterium]|nr:SUMF1/EgtB/PvdO family nonheme iron enzyme [Kofleriaceae bacterium]